MIGSKTTTATTMRKATRRDTERIAEIMFSDPGQEAVGIAFGDETLASASAKELVRMPGGTMGWQNTVLAERDGIALGVLQANGASAQIPLTLPLLLRFARLFGPVRIVRALPRIHARRRVDFVEPDDAFIVHELHVHPRSRGRGIGGEMLCHADDEARSRGHHLMALTTHMHNPARRLYERHGYTIAEARTDASYERYTGIPGRYLMVKELT